MHEDLVRSIHNTSVEDFFNVKYGGSCAIACLLHFCLIETTFDIFPQEVP